MYVCNISVCLFEKCSILLPKVTNQTFPTSMQEGTGLRNVVIYFSLKWCQMCEMEYASDSAMWVFKGYVSSVSSKLFWKAREAVCLFDLSVLSF